MPHNGSTLEGGRKGGRRGTVRWGTPDRCWHEVLPVTRRPSLRASSETPPASPPSKTREVVVVRMPVPLREGKRGAAAGRGRGRWVDDVWLMTGPASTPSHRCRRGGKVAMGAVPMPDSDYFNADKGACAASPLFSLCCCCDAVAGAVWGLPLPLLRCVRRKPAERHFAFPVPQRAARIRRFPVFQHTHGAGDALYAFEVALSLQKLCLDKLKALHKAADGADDFQARRRCARQSYNRVSSVAASL